MVCTSANPLLAATSSMQSDTVEKVILQRRYLLLCRKYDTTMEEISSNVDPITNITASLLNNLWVSVGGLFNILYTFGVHFHTVYLKFNQKNMWKRKATTDQKNDGRSDVATMSMLARASKLSYVGYIYEGVTGQRESLIRT
jgi:hypothetical protein